MVLLKTMGGLVMAAGLASAAVHVIKVGEVGIASEVRLEQSLTF